MNHTTSQPIIPPPPPLPRFDLDDDELDESDVVATTERPLVDPLRAGRFARAIARAPSVVVDATSEVAVEDILLEVYAEDPPPPKTRRSAHLLTAQLLTPPSPVEAAAVDALLRASVPAFPPYQASFAPPPYPLPRVAPDVAPGFASYDESPSVAPVAFPSMSFMVAGPVGPTSAAAHHAMNAPTVAPASRSRAGAVVGWGAALLVLSASIAGVLTIGLETGAFARLRTPATVSARTAATPAAPTPRSVPITAPPAPTPLPAVSVDSLPKPAIGEDQTLVSFPASAQGHRFFFDGKAMAVTAEPVLLRCGRHNVRIGSAGKVRVTDLTCGHEQTLTR